MIRRAFVRRMAAVALSGMLGSALTWRREEAEWDADYFTATYARWHGVPADPVFEEAMISQMESLIRSASKARNDTSAP